ncbi:MAG: DUF1963 domain-containing protein [Candidatus Obscuribacterales bacterium]|nr:DUF1963 domain-containing protein [Candidatus Obscuribacterales bacterium]
MRSSIALLFESNASRFESSGSEPGHASLRSKLGGAPDLPDGIDSPIDNRSRPMLFVGQINFAEVPSCDSAENAPRVGVLYWFLNRDLSFSNPKDRHSFRVLWCADAERHKSVRMEVAPFESTGVLSSQSMSATEGVDSQSSMGHRLFGELHRFSAEASEIAAFASNGISWSAARRRDSCYEHLVAAAQQWRLLWFLPTELSDHRLPDLALMINHSDLSNGALSKAWMVPLPGR